MRTHLVTFLLLLALLAACGGDEPGGGGTTAAGPEPEEPVLCPLTGVEAAEGVDVSRPALAVKIDNAPPSRPQLGLNAADVVYEELGEGGLTRFLAVFHCSEGEVGPVRSARNVDVELLKEYEPALFGYSGANNQVLAKIDNADWIVDLRHGSHGDAYTRADDREAPYNLMSSTEQLRSLDDAAGVQGPPETTFRFNADVTGPPAQQSPQEGAEPAPPPAPGGSVQFSFADRSDVRYVFDQATGTYLRFHGDAPHTLAGGEQVRTANVVIQKVQVRPGTVRDASGTPTVETTLVGTGEATVVRGGTSVNGRWSRPSLNDNTTFTDESGQPIEFAPGPVFIHLVPQERPVTIQ